MIRSDALPSHRQEHVQKTASVSRLTSSLELYFGRPTDCDLPQEHCIGKLLSTLFSRCCAVLGGKQYDLS